MRNPLNGLSSEEILYTGFCIEWYLVGLELFRKQEITAGAKFLKPITNYSDYIKMYPSY